MFSENYLKKNQCPVLIPDNPDSDLGISIVIPCFNEPEILKTLDSIYQCTLPECSVEIIVIINHPENSDKNTIQYSTNTKTCIDNWNQDNQQKTIKTYSPGPFELPKKWAGPGLARKKGMDEALRRFSVLNKPKGIIVSLDADTLVAKNYLLEIEKYFSKHGNHIGATIQFEHQKENIEPKLREGINLYEKYLTYYKNCLAFIGYPYPLYTVGSAFAVTALGYVKRGGMTRKKSGEDFYFLQTLAQTGIVGELNSTTVYPSSRVSNRVVFGTGPTLGKWMEGKEDLTKTYNFQAFIDLKVLFDIKEDLFKINQEAYNTILKKLPAPVSNFMIEDDFFGQIDDLNQNCSNLKIFNKRFFQVFNAFKILKFLNFSHTGFYEKDNMERQIIRLQSFT